MASYIILNGIYSNMLLDFNIKNSTPGSNKKDSTVSGFAIFNPMPLLNASPAKCPDGICFKFSRCIQ